MREYIVMNLHDGHFQTIKTSLIYDVGDICWVGANNYQIIERI